MSGSRFCLIAVVLACVCGAASVSAASPAARSGDARTLEAVLGHIAKNYVDPSRVDPQKMLWAAAQALDREVPEVLLESSPGQDALTLQVSGERLAFPAASVRSLRTFEKTVREILRFVDARRAASSKPNAEYVAVNGMLSTLDPHSLLLDPAEAKEFSTNISSRFSGIGIVIDLGRSNAGATPGVPFVRTVMKGGPAEEFGLRACDGILGVEDRWTLGMGWEELVGLLRGPTGSPVWVTLQRDGAVKDVVVTRAEIKVPSVSSRRLDGDVGLVRIERFVSGTGSEVRGAIADLKKAGVSAWILDLRQNPGGLLSQAIEVASAFIRSGPVVTTAGAGGREREVKVVKQQGPNPVEEGPLVVLVGPATVSAAEVLTGALQNRNRAAILGRTSFGKGSVQVLFDYVDGSKLKLTVAHYMTPGGASLQSRGIVPDIELVPVPVPREGRIRIDDAETPWREADLERAFASREPTKHSEMSLRYLAATPDGEEEVSIARDLVASTKPRTRSDALVRGASSLNEKSSAEEAKIAAALEEAGLDWSPGTGETLHAPPRLSARCAQRGPPVRDRVPVDCEVRNEGPSDAVRVYGRAPSSAFDLKDEEIVVGRVPVGASRKVSIAGSLAEDPSARVTYVVLSFSASSVEKGAAAAVEPVRIEIPARPRPSANARLSRLEIRIEAPLETKQETLRLRASVRDKAGVLDAWVRISNDSVKLDRKKVAYFSRPEDSPLDRLEIAADVPLRPGLNEIGVCSREKDEERCESAFVYRLPESAGRQTSPHSSSISF